MKAIALVIVYGGVAEEFAPLHVDVRIIDHDNLEEGDPPPEIPRDVGFEELLKRADQHEGYDFTWEDRRNGYERRALPQPRHDDHLRGMGKNWRGGVDRRGAVPGFVSK